MSEEFDKELPSDVDDATALPLLDEQADTNEQWKDFSESDLPLMLEVFSILKMKAGERLIAAGEYASFCGIILQGTFTAQVTPTLKVELKAGDTIGEMALFEGGERNADVFTGHDAAGCILAMIRYNDLETLEEMERYQSLARKLKNLFAVASISKLRNMINSKPAGATPAAAQAHAPESIFQAKIPGGPKTTAAATTPATPNAAQAAASSTQSAAAPSAAAAPSPAASEAATKLLADLQAKLNARDATIVELQAQIAKLTTAAATVAAAAAAAPAAVSTPAPAAAATPVKKAAAAPASSPAAAAKSPAGTKASPAAAATAKPKVALTSPTASRTAAAGGAKVVVVKKPAAKATSAV